MAWFQLAVIRDAIPSGSTASCDGVGGGVPVVRVHPATPKVGLRATHANEVWHIDTIVIRLLDGTRTASGTGLYGAQVLQLDDRSVVALAQTSVAIPASAGHRRDCSSTGRLLRRPAQPRAAPFRVSWTTTAEPLGRAAFAIGAERQDSNLRGHPIRHEDTATEPSRLVSVRTSPGH